MKTRCHPQNRKYTTYRNAVRKRAESRNHRQHAQILVKFGQVVFEFCEQTDKQTYSSQHFAPLPPGGEVITAEK